MQLLFHRLKNWALQVHVAKDNSILGDVRFRESKIPDELSTNGHKANVTELSQAVKQENAIKCQVPGR